MTVTKKLAIVIMDHEKIHDINQVIVKYSVSSSQSSSHVLFDVEPINMADIAEDLTFFRLTGENKEDLDRKMNEMIEELNQLGTDYSIRNMETSEFYTTIESVGAIYVKLDKIKNIPKGTYKQIDELKNAKTEFGYCKGYKPTFRPLEGISIEELSVKQENIYLFSTPAENMPKLIEYISENVMKINPDFEIESVIYK